MTKRIAFVSNSSYSMAYFRKGVMKQLIADGYEVHVIAPLDHQTPNIIALGCHYHQVNFSTKSLNPLADLMMHFKLLQTYRKIKPELIFHYTVKPNIYGTLAAKIIGIPSISLITGFGSALMVDNWLNSLVKSMYRFALGFADEVWFLNTDDIQFFSLNEIVSEHKIVHIPGEGVNTTEFDAPIIENKKLSPFVFLMIARVLKDKGVFEYVAAAKAIKQEFPEVIFRLLGPCDSDNPTAISKNQVDEWHQSGVIEYLGISNHVQLEMQDADCVVLPSYREGISKVLMEAAAMRKPLIATNVPGCKELIEEGVTGFLCEVRDISSLIGKMKSMLQLSNKALLQMGDKGREKMLLSFDEKIIINYYHNAIQKYIFKQQNAFYPSAFKTQAFPKITIITAVYNNRQYIKDAIESVLGQSYSNIEYIVVDGRSTDGSMDIIKKYKDRIHIVISEPDQGLYDALNKGISLATGDIIGVLHSDDFFAHPYVLESIAHKFDEETQAVFGDLDYISNTDNKKITRKWRTQNYTLNKFKWGWMPPHPTVFIRKSIFEKYGSYNTTLTSSSDYELIIRLFYVNKIRVGFIKDVLVKMRVGGQSNRSVMNRLRAHFEDYKAWYKAGNVPAFYTMIFKLLRKIPQYRFW
jgi:glycosyltransferase involved in cell wall biosynthesis